MVVGALLGLVAVAHLVAPDRADANLLLVYEAALLGVALALAMMHEPAARGMGVTDLGLRCVLGFHRYFTNHAPDRSTVYLECRRCGKVKDFPDPNAIHALGPPGGGG